MPIIVKYFNMSVRQIFLLLFLQFGYLDNFSVYQQLHMFGMECGNLITSHIISGSTKIVKSRIECAAHCLVTTDCGTILFDKKVGHGQEGLCTLATESSSTSPYVLESNSSVCFMKRASVETTTVPSPTETTTTAPTTTTPTTPTTTTELTTIPTTPTTTTTTTSTTTTMTTPTTTTATTTTPTTTTASTTLPTTTTVTPTTTTPTTPTPTTSIGETIIDIIDNVNNMCNTNSQHDIAIVTTNGVHLYDDAASLTNGACRNMTIAELFQGFTSLPDRNTWKALLTYTNTYFDLFTDAGQVYRWQKNSGNIVPVSGYPKTEKDYIAAAVYHTTTNIFSGARWAVYTQITGPQTLYFFDASTDTIYYYRNQQPKEGSFSISDTANMDNNGKPINLWYNLPSNVVGVTGQENSNKFIVVDVDLNVYDYDIPDPNNAVCSLQGQLQL
ncbi:probable maltase-glucoamylase 2 [Magallana gigas]|uniref:probable maltase-glucoamylase 2 n=1 Tax=Magallana gigas TaxID=29159 RepID=UPI0033426659